MEIITDLDERAGLPSGSNWRRYELCAGSWQLEQEAGRLGQLANRAPTQASTRGERIHGALADEMVELSVTEATSTEFLSERADDQVKRIFGEEPVTVLKEKRLWLTLQGRPVASGRFDRVIHNGTIALVQDFKTGWSEPDPASQNAQLKFLCVVVALNFSTVTEVIAQIISGPFGVTETRFELSQLAQAYNDVLDTVKALRDPQATFNPSPEACRFCPALNICQAVKALTVPLTRLQYSALPDGERAAKLLDEIAVVENHLEQIKAHYKRIMTDDPAYQVPGYALVQGAPRRSVTDWVAARAKLEEFVDGEALDALATFSIPNVERLLGEAIGVKNGAKLKEAFKEALGDLLELKYPAPTLARVKGSLSVNGDGPCHEAPSIW